MIMCYKKPNLSHPLNSRILLISILVMIILVSNIYILYNLCISNIQYMKSPVGNNIEKLGNTLHGDLLEPSASKRAFDSEFNQHSATWIIISFSDINYFTVAKIWYDQMTEIGYNIHNIACLDKLTYTRFQQIRYRSFLADDTTSFREEIRLSSIWKTRINTIQTFLNKNFNVFISDVDVIFLRHIDLETLPRRYDSFHGIGTIFPLNVFKKW